ncbi:hypothetical protein TKK_0016172 [Trichogramma kaykai]|uniref:DUF4794 domain-containing protein n=1 Tax=Trichogramma kaykai TaxID=54128 RepID=A0ABD2W8I4_9HYME
MERRTAKVGMMALLVLVHCVSLLALDRSESRALYSESRTPSQQQQQQQQQHQQQQRLRLSRKLNSKHNEVSVAAAEPNKKTSHVLSGGHLRSEVSTTTTTTTTTTSELPPSQNDTSLDDDGLLLSSASELGPGQVSTSVTSSTSSTDDEDKKTLSQQVKEGKYGLIQNEIFSEPPKRPGIISYASNPEVPRDTAENLGGLDKDEIWLAENHVLVLKGGGLPEDHADDGEEPVDGVPSWPPIDDYEAPRRQVKIPAHPRVPPPFPVQLTDGGPVQLFAANGSSIIDNNASISIELLPDSFRGFLPGEGPYFPQLNSSESPPLDQQAQAKRPKAEFYPALPPGAVVVPPPSTNQSDYDDEDQSIYYPPPYSFVYHQDNSTDIPPGPLVPGIILPPPPDFFSVLEDDDSAEKEKLAKAKKLRDDTISVFLPSVASQSNQLGSSGAQPSPSSRKPSKTYKTPAGATYASKTYGRSKFKSTTYTPKASYIEVTTSTPPSIASSSPDPLSSNQVFESSTEKAPWLYTSSEKTTWFETSTEKPRWRGEASPTKNTWFGSSKQPSWFESSTAKPPPTWHQASSTEKRPSWRTRNKEKSNWFKTNTEKAPWRVSSAPVPLVSFFASTTPNSVEQAVESTPAPLQSVLTTEQPPQTYPSQASYYFYEETGDALSSTPAPLLYFGGVSAEPPAYYKLETDDKREYYDVELVTQAAPAKSTLKAATPSPTVTTTSTTTTTTPSPLASYQSSVQSQTRPRLLPSEPIYYRPVPTRSQPKLTYFATTPKSKIHYYKASTGSSSKSKPIYQYSFEASNYARPSSLRLGPEPPPQQQLEPRQVPRRPKELPSPTLFAAKHFGETIAAQTPLRQSVSAANYGPSYNAVRSIRPNSLLGSSTVAPPLRDTTLAAHQQYFTKQDELLLDDVTKEYFTVFGKKLPASTTPIYGKSSVTERPTYATPAPANGHRAANVKVHYGDHTPGPSLVDDILVNFKQPLPSLEPQAEFVPLLGADPDSGSFRPRPHQQQQQQLQQQQQQLRQQHHLDYGQARTAPDHVENHVERPNSYFAYRLPGDGGHFYFLTPQAIGPSSREDPYHFFARPGRLLRRRRRPDSA